MRPLAKVLRTGLALGAALVGCAGCAAPVVPGNVDAQTPGWTGRTIVAGSTSTVAGDTQATYNQQKWQLGPNH